MLILAINQNHGKITLYSGKTDRPISPPLLLPQPFKIYLNHIMITTKICHIPARGAFYPVFLFILLIIGGSSGGGTLSPADKINVLSRSIDSLDLIKQELKRNGRSISELEQSQTILRDSLRILHNVMQKASKQPMRTDSPTHYRPDNTFDRATIIVGIVALLSGLIFITGTLRASAKRRKRTLLKAANSPQGNSHPLHSIKETTVCAAYPEYRAPLQADTPPIKPDFVAQPGPLDMTWKNLPGIQPEKRLSEAAPQAAAQSPVNDREKKVETIESRVLNASRNGLDIQAISRKFHLSTDHVALILKMAENTPGSRKKF